MCWRKSKYLFLDDFFYLLNFRKYLIVEKNYRNLLILSLLMNEVVFKFSIVIEILCRLCLIKINKYRSPLLFLYELITVFFGFDFPLIIIIISLTCTLCLIFLFIMMATPAPPYKGSSVNNPIISRPNVFIMLSSHFTKANNVQLHYVYFPH